VEINFLMRACALPPRVLAAAPAIGSPPCEFLVLATEEVFGGKIKAMIDRRHPRDLLDRDFRTYTVERISTVDEKELDRLLYPLLKADDRPKPSEMLAATRPLLEGVLDHTREEAYLVAIASGKYQPQLLFPKHPEIVERIRLHPALLWKAQNVAEYLAQSRKPS
jgi:hypothetical protein